MRTREEVLEDYDLERDGLEGVIEAMADRLRELEAELKKAKDQRDHWCNQAGLNGIVTGIRELESAAGDPVAWMVMNGYSGEVLSYHASEAMAREAKPNHHAYAILPLYAHPSAAAGA